MWRPWPGSLHGLRKRNKTAAGLRAESQHFIVFSEFPEARTRDVLADLEEYDALLRRLFNADPAFQGAKLEVYLYRNQDSFERVYTGGIRNARGLYSATTEIVSAHANHGDSFGEANFVLFHEYAHHIMRETTAGGHPAWVIEGYAEFYATAEFQSERVLLGRPSEGRAYTLTSDDNWLSVEQMLTSRVAELDPGQLERFYAQSWMMMHYCMTDPERRRKLGVYLSGLRASNADAIAVFTEAFGQTPAQFQNGLRGYTHRRIPMFAIERDRTARDLPVAVTRLSAAADRILPLDVRLRLGRYQADDGQSLLSEIRTLAAPYPDDAFAIMTLARAEVMLGDPAAARALLEPLLAATPENASALYLTGFSHMQDTHPSAPDRETSLVEARRYFARAFRADPEHVPTLYRYAQTYFSLPGPMAVDQLNILMEAYNLAPQVDEISMTSAMALLEVERFDEAMPILRALASEPHGGGLSTRARELLTQAEERRRVAPPAVAAE